MPLFPATASRFKNRVRYRWFQLPAAVALKGGASNRWRWRLSFPDRHERGA
jgi:hypothetical protein